MAYADLTLHRPSACIDGGFCKTLVVQVTVERPCNKGVSFAHVYAVSKDGLSQDRPNHLQVNSLSGGERRRLQLAAVLVEKPNLLILDEPTNDLDLQTVEVVEELLSDYKGCLLVVSHDRAFMENLADRLFVVSGDGLVRLYDGLYSEVSHCHARTFTLSCTPVCMFYLAMRRLASLLHHKKLPLWCDPVCTSLAQQYLAVDAEPNKHAVQHIESCIISSFTARHNGGAMYT